MKQMTGISRFLNVGPLRYTNAVCIAIARTVARVIAGGMAAAGALLVTVVLLAIPVAIVAILVGGAVLILRAI
jgi:hypothetical protein